MSKRISKIPKRAVDTQIRFSRTPIRGIRGIRAIHAEPDRDLSPFYFIFINLKMAGVLLCLRLIARWYDVGAQEEGNNEEYKTRTRLRRSIRADRGRIWVLSDR
jgi:hypothetical protein